ISGGEPHRHLQAPVILQALAVPADGVELDDQFRKDADELRAALLRDPHPCPRTTPVVDETLRALFRDALLARALDFAADAFELVPFREEAFLLEQLEQHRFMRKDTLDAFRAVTQSGLQRDRAAVGMSDQVNGTIDPRQDLINQVYLAIEAKIS